jgi:hypothetical protein
MMIMADGVVARLADNLWRADIDRLPLSPITDVHQGLGIEAAYTMQSYNIERRVAADWVIRGRKVGLTSRPMKELLGVSEPDFAVPLDDVFVEDGDEISLGGAAAAARRGGDSLSEPTSSRARHVITTPTQRPASRERSGRGRATPAIAASGQAVGGTLGRRPHSQQPDGRCRNRSMLRSVPMADLSFLSLQSRSGWPAAERGAWAIRLAEAST